MAFGFDSFIQSGGRNDPRYIQWVAQLYESKSGNVTTKVYPLKTCTEEDLSKFYEPEARMVSKLKHLQSFESLFCLDWESHDFSIFGSWDSDSHYRALDVMAVPCATKLSSLGSNYKGNEGMRDDCKNDYNSTLEYLNGPADIVIYKNHGSFKTHKYGESRLKKSAMFESAQTDIRQASWVGVDINLFEIVDEVGALQLGQQDEAEFEQIKLLPAAPSVYTKWPTQENPDGVFTFGSIWIEQGQSKTTIERTTYSLLEWLGDIGGLADSLVFIGRVLIGPIAAFMMKANILELAFLIPPESRVFKGSPGVKMSEDYQKPTRFKGMALIWSFLNCSKRNKHRQMMYKAEKDLTKQLDLVSFFERQKMQTL